MKAKLLVAAALAAGLTTQAVTIEFSDGQNGDFLNGFYAQQGIHMHTLRFHSSTAEGNVPFPFVDNWGAVQNSDAPAHFAFTSPIDEFTANVIVQDIPGIPLAWSLSAYNSEGILIGFEEIFPAPSDRFHASAITLSVPGEIAAIALHSNTKFGVDSISYTPQPILPEPPPATPVPEGGSAMFLMLAGVIPMGLLYRRISRDPRKT